MPGYSSLYWAERTASNRRRSHSAIRGQQSADVVVIGGGLTGAAAAYVLANGGLDVIVVEANRIAGGSTAASLGAILPEPDAWYRDVDALAGRRAARAMWHEARKGAADFAAAIARLKIRCDLTQAPYLINSSARDGAQAAALRKEMASRRDAGVGVPWVTPAAVRTEAGVESGGALGPGGAFTYDPVRAALGLVAAAESKGARVFEKSEVRRISFTRKDATVFLRTASIRTRGIVVATGEPGSLFGQLRRHVRVSDAAVVVTEPFNAAMRRAAARRRSVVADAHDSFGTSTAARSWLRWVSEDRAMFGGAATRVIPPRQADKALVQKTAQLMYELSLRYPDMSGLPAHWSWRLPVVTTPDGLPWIGPHRNYPFHFFAMAFGWHGDSLAWAAARAALRFFKGEATREDEVLGFGRYL
jgi:glycine/D-amino acid oxidase-like deaminating enzyme